MVRMMGVVVVVVVARYPHLTIITETLLLFCGSWLAAGCKGIIINYSTTSTRYYQY